MAKNKEVMARPLGELIEKKKAMAAELIKFHVSMDPSHLKSASNLVQFKREFKQISRAVAILSQGNKK